MGSERRLLINRDGIDLTLRWIPGCHWVRLTLLWDWHGQFEPGHGWLYANLVRRDAWRLGRLGFVIMRLTSRAAVSP